MKKFIVATKYKDNFDIIDIFLYGESIGFNGIRMDREWFDSKEAAEENLSQHSKETQEKLAIYEVSVSVVKLT